MAVFRRITWGWELFTGLRSRALSTKACMGFSIGSLAYSGQTNYPTGGFLEFAELLIFGGTRDHES